MPKDTNTVNPEAQNILDTASECINGARAGDYGRAIDNFSRIAEMWTALMPVDDQGCRIEFTPEDVSNMMICVKLARLVNTPGHTDSLVDICGYAALGAQVFEDTPDSFVGVDFAGIEERVIANGFMDEEFWAAVNELAEENDGFPTLIIKSNWSDDELSELIGKLVSNPIKSKEQFGSGLAAYMSIMQEFAGTDSLEGADAQTRSAIGLALQWVIQTGTYDPESTRIALDIPSR